MRELFNRFRFLLQRRRMDRDLAEEMRDHFERKAEKNAAAGMTGEEARYAAQRQLGNLVLQQERSRASWGFPLLESVVQDVRYGLRGLRKAPAFTTVAILTLALGIGATTAIFSIVNAILLRPLPYKDARRIVHLWTNSPQWPEFNVGESKPDFDDIKSRAHSFETMVMYRPVEMNLSGAGEPEQLSGLAVSPDFLALFGVHPQLGRDFQPDDAQGKNGHVVLLSYGIWERRYGGDRNVLGRQVTLDQKPYTVIGVLPRRFDFTFDSSRVRNILIPLHINADDSQNRGASFFFVFAKLKPGTGLKTAQAELDSISAWLSRQYPKDESGRKLNAVLLQEEATEGARSGLMMLLAAVGFLLMIACANVSNLILARGTQRQREISVRAALGASRGRIVRQLLVESLVLALLGGAAALVVALYVIDGFRTLAPADIPRLGELRIEPAVAWFALIFSSFAGIVCGLAPALHVSRRDLVFALKGRTSTAGAQGRSHFSLRNFFVVSEVALALALLTGSALLAQSLIRTLRVDPGFRTDHLLTAELNLPAARYPSPEARLRFARRMLDELQARPELSRVAMGDHATLSGEINVATFDPASLGLVEKPTVVNFQSVNPGYFDAMGIPMRSGRAFTDRDAAGAAKVIILNEAMARRYFPGRNPVGLTIQFGQKPDSRRQIVGVAADIRDVQLRTSPTPQYYAPLLQNSPIGSLFLYIRTKADDPAQVASALRQSVWAVDKDVPVSHVESMAAAIFQSVAEPRFRTGLLSAFAIAGLALTLIGIYGVVSYSVNQRTQEIGIRIALGAQPEDVRRLILKQGFRLALLGAAIGLLGSLGLMRLLTSQLYEVKPGDPATLIGAALLMLVVALCASYIPARRATQVDPMVALRHE